MGEEDEGSCGVALLDWYIPLFRFPLLLSCLRLLLLPFFLPSIHVAFFLSSQALCDQVFPSFGSIA